MSDGIIAPGYDAGGSGHPVQQEARATTTWSPIDPAYQPAPVEHKQVFGITFEQGRNELVINADTMLTQLASPRTRT